MSIEISVGHLGSGTFSILKNKQYTQREFLDIYQDFIFTWNEPFRKIKTPAKYYYFSKDKVKHHSEAVEYRTFFMDYVSKIDTQLDELLANYYLRDLSDFDIWLQLRDQTRMSLNDKQIILSKILKFRIPGYKKRNELTKKFQDVIKLRNSFAHSRQLQSVKEDVVMKKMKIEDYDKHTGKLVERNVTFNEIRERVKDLLFIQGEIHRIDRIFSKRRWS